VALPGEVVAVQHHKLDGRASLISSLYTSLKRGHHRFSQKVQTYEISPRGGTLQKGAEQLLGAIKETFFGIGKDGKTYGAFPKKITPVKGVKGECH
jgi:hypothetical protein